VRDVAQVRDGYAPQTNVVRHDGKRAALLEIEKTGSASTLAVVAQIRALLPHPGRPAEVAAGAAAVDQSVFVTSAIDGVLHEALAACLTAAMILLFLGSWRATLIIAITIPLSVLAALIALAALGQTLNIMTLGGLALAVGVLVDDATVAIENIAHHRETASRWSRPSSTGGRDRAAHAGVHDVHLHRVPADVPAQRRGALPVRAAGRGGGVRDDGVVLSCPAR
jgi:multidrug efflux pump subunit AcrB